MEHDPTRRMLITALAGLTIASTVPVSSAAGTGSVQNKSRTLVVYFSRSGNTRVIAGVRLNPALPIRKITFRL